MPRSSGVFEIGVNLVRNAFAGFVAMAAWAAVGVWVARTQGVETWGLLTLFASAQVLATALEFGLSLYVTRRVARSVRKWPLRVLGAAEALAFGQAACMALIGGVLVLTGAGRALSASALDADTVSRCLGWIALAVACGWPATFYRAVLAGLGSQAAFARSLAYFGAARIGIVVPVFAASGSLEAAFAAMCVVGLIECAVSRWFAVERTARFSFRRASSRSIRRLFRRNLQVGASASLVGLNGSLDKFVVASVLDLRMAALYNSAWMVCSAALWTLQPVTQSLYPRICQTVHDPRALWHTNMLLSGAIALILIPAAIAALFIGRILGPIWFEDPHSRAVFFYFVATLLVGVAINSQTILSWYAGLASDDTRRNLHVGILAAAFTAFLFPALLANVGFPVAPASWLFINTFTLLYPGIAVAVRLRRVATVLLIAGGIIGVVALSGSLLLPDPLAAVLGVHP